MSGVDVLAVIRRHAESHRAMADSDAYSAQEAPRLEAALESIAALIEADKEYDAAEQECLDHHRPLFSRGKEWSERQSQIEARCDAAIARRSAALAAVSPK